MTESRQEKIQREMLYQRAFNLFKQHHSPQDIADQLGITPAQVVRVVNRRLKDHFHLNGPDKVRAAIAIKQDHLGRLNRRLEQIQNGLTEITTKESPRGSEISESEKFYVSAEVSLLREIRATENEINELKGLLQLSRDDLPENDGISVTIKLDDPAEEPSGDRPGEL